MFSLECSCGGISPVRAANAGASIHCSVCGALLSVPSLSVLRSHSDRGEPVPASKQNSDAAQLNLPDKLFHHCCGYVDSRGRISVSAVNNFVGVVANTIEEFVRETETSNGFEFLVSYALLPNGKRLVSIDVAPPVIKSHAIDQVRLKLEDAAAPKVVDGPVAFALYHRVNLEPVTEANVVPFREYQSRIGEIGIEDALIEAAGLTRENVAESKRAPRKPFHRLRQFLFGGTTRQKESSDSTSKDLAEQWIQWLQHVDESYAGTSFATLRKTVVHHPDNLASHVALAHKYAENEDWAEAVDLYSMALKIDPTCSPLYARRASCHLAAGNREASLADWNVAVERDPHDPWLLFQRSRIFADLEAWAQVDSDLKAACELAPVETVFLQMRASVRQELDDRDGAVSDLNKVIDLDPNNAAAHGLLGSIYLQGDRQDLNLAMNHLAKAIELSPTEVEPRVHRALAYALENKFELAREDCEAAIAMQPDNDACHGMLGRVLQMQGEYPESIDACNRALELGSENPFVLLSRGIAFAETDQTELAVLDCNAAEALDPDNPLVCQLRGLLSLERGELESAMQAFARASELAPQWSNPRQQIAFLHRLNQEPEEAVKEQTILVEQEPKCAGHYVNRAFAHAQLGSFDKAMDDYTQACKLDPENEVIYFLRGCFFVDRQEPEKALADFDQALHLADDHDEAKLHRAAVHLQLDRFEDALADYDQLVARYPDHPQAYAGRAFTRQMLGDELGAEADWDELRRIAPEHSQETLIQTLQTKVNYLERQKRYEDAIDVAGQIIEIAQDRPFGYHLRGWIYWYSEQHVEALEDYNRLLEIKPDDAAYLNARGQVLAEMGEYRSALDDLDAAIERSRTSGETQVLAFALNGQSLALAGLGQMDESTRSYEESIQLCPDNAWAYYNRAIVMQRAGDHQRAKQLFQRALDVTRPALPLGKRKRAEALLAKLSE